MEKTGVSSDNPHYAISSSTPSTTAPPPFTVQNDLNSRARNVLSGENQDSNAPQRQLQRGGESNQRDNDGDEGMHL